MAKSKKASKKPSNKKAPAKTKKNPKTIPVKKSAGKVVKKTIAKKKEPKKVNTPAAKIKILLPLEDARKGKISKIISYLKNGGDINAQVDHTLLVESIIGGQIQVFEELIKRGADINLKDNKNKSPLHFAAGLRRTKFVEVLLKQGADSNGKDSGGLTPLHTTLRGPKGLGYDGNSKDADKVVKLLLKAGADVNATENSGRTPLHFAVAYDSPALKELEKAGGINMGPGQLAMF